MHTFVYLHQSQYVGWNDDDNADSFDENGRLMIMTWATIALYIRKFYIETHIRCEFELYVDLRWVYCPSSLGYTCFPSKRTNSFPTRNLRLSHTHTLSLSRSCQPRAQVSSSVHLVFWLAWNLFSFKNHISAQKFVFLLFFLSHWTKFLVDCYASRGAVHDSLTLSWLVWCYCCYCCYSGCSPFLPAHINYMRKTKK